MRVANISGRAALLEDGLALDLETASDGRFPSDPAAVFERWSEIATWAEQHPVASDPRATAYDPRTLEAPSPRPAQIFGIGLNYADHAAEAGLDLPTEPLVFTKFPSALTGADADVALTGETVDWEAELVVVIGAGGRDIDVADVPDRIAGYAVGQDVSDRTVQWSGGASAQFNLGKSFAGFAPVGPAVVTLDELRDPDRLAITCTLVDASGERTVMQDSSTEQLVFDVGELVSRLSRVVELRPGDLIFTGTPPGVGSGRSPQRFLATGESLETTIEGVGTIVQRFG